MRKGRRREGGGSEESVCSIGKEHEGVSREGKRY